MFDLSKKCWSGVTLLAFILLQFCQLYCYGQLSLPKVFGHHMILQREMQIPVWGNATPGALIKAQLGKIVATAKAGQDGKWTVRFPKFKAGGPYRLKITENGRAASAITLEGILIGDIWLASGQSNMEWQVQQAMDARKEIENANFPQIHFLMVDHDKELMPQPDIASGKWKVCDTASVKELSAVAYYFARKIQRDQNIPIGIIQSAWGGTPVEAWTSREALLTSPITNGRVSDGNMPVPGDFIKDSLNGIRFWEMIYHPQNGMDKIIPVPAYNDAGWPAMEVPGLLKDAGIKSSEAMVWMRKKIILPASFAGKELMLHAGHPEMNYSLYFNGEEICTNVWNAAPVHSFSIPGRLVKPGENTVAIRLAVLWGGGGLNPPAEEIYITDGISKVSLAGKWLYKEDLEPALPVIHNYHYFPSLLFNAMIHPLIPYGIKGVIWYQGEANAPAAYDYRTLFPMMISDWRARWGQGKFPFLFVQLANFHRVKPLPAESDWAELREAQTLTLSQPNTGMACTIDIGDADNIHPANKQEVGRRLALLADKLVYKQPIVASGPLFNGFKKVGNSIRVDFIHTGSGLSAKDGNSLTGFTIAGKDRHFQQAHAVIEGNQVIVAAEGVTDPVAVRYAWADNSVCNLVNSVGLPAIPFRTDNWKGITQK
ncbi:sialate O-acetylesterase [Chitinophaga polysaccharea]|nr:sialate O-acetylesterase [Chitinophaga polysaccharea]